MNKKLVKRVAVASLAALMTIPNLTIIPGNNANITYANEFIEVFQERLKLYEKQLKDYEALGNTEMVEQTKQKIENTKQRLEGQIQSEEKQAQKAAQAAAAQAEKDRIANTVYPLTARYVKDFVPIVDDGKPHFYERPDLPGVIFTLEKDSLGTVRDLKPNVEITEGEDFHREATLGGSTTKTFDNTYQEIKVTYTSPFNFCGEGAKVYGSSASSFSQDTEKNGIYLADGWCHWIGKNIEVSLTRVTNISYKSGWPDYYVGKSVNDLSESEWDPQYGGFPHDPNLIKVPLEVIKSHLKVEFSTKEKAKIRNTEFTEFNIEHGNSWVHEQDIYSVAREHGTDYTDEERQLLGLK